MSAPPGVDALALDAAGVDAEFFPDGRLRALLVVTVGRPGPDAWADRLPRLTYDDVVHTV